MFAHQETQSRARQQVVKKFGHNQTGRGKRIKSTLTERCAHCAELCERATSAAAARKLICAASSGPVATRRKFPRAQQNVILVGQFNRRRRRRGEGRARNPIETNSSRAIVCCCRAARLQVGLLIPKEAAFFALPTLCSLKPARKRAFSCGRRRRTSSSFASSSSTGTKSMANLTFIPIGRFAFGRRLPNLMQLVQFPEATQRRRLETRRIWSWSPAARVRPPARPSLAATRCGVNKQVSSACRRADRPPRRRAMF